MTSPTPTDMALPRPTVVALDFSPGSESALVRAATLAARAGAPLHAVTADPDEAGPHVTHDELEAFVAQALGEDAADALAVVGGLSVLSAVLHYAERVGAGLLVVGTRGRPGVGRLLAGSVAEACVAAAPCPVLTVPHGVEAHEPSAAAPVLVAVDFGGLGAGALAAGRAFADLHGAPLEVVHVVRDLGPYAGLSRTALSLDVVDPERAEAVRQRLRRCEAVRQAAPDALHVALGEASRQIAAVAAARAAGAVVLGTHGRTGVAHAILGSTAESTLRRSPCAVLTVRPRAVPRPVRLAVAGS